MVLISMLKGFKKYFKRNKSEDIIRIINHRMEDEKEDVFITTIHDNLTNIEKELISKHFMRENCKYINIFQSNNSITIVIIWR